MKYSRKPQKNPNKQKIIKGYRIIAFIALLPLISVALAQFLGFCLGCTVNEASTSDCIRWGINFGETLSTMFLMGWAFFISIPLALVLLIAWTFYTNKYMKNK